MTTPQAALSLIQQSIEPLDTTPVPAAEAVGHTLAAPLISRAPAPRLTQSAMDGFAARSADLHGGATLRLLRAEARAGHQDPHAAVGPGEAMRIFTGAALPAGADVVIRQELATRVEETLRVERAFDAWADVRRAGEDFQSGDLLLDAGLRLRPCHIALALASGVGTVTVRERPHVHLIISGDEVQTAQTPDLNGPLLRAILTARGARVTLDYLSDSMSATRDAIGAAAQAGAALIITTGGLSVGAHDHVRAAALAAGVKWTFESVRQRPGRPVSFGMLDKTALLAMPGPPAAVQIIAASLLRAALDALDGVSTPISASPLACEVRPHPTDWLWLPCVWENNALRPLGGARLRELANAQALACLPPAAAPLPAGTSVSWWPM
jgi:molybdopterin molybdotransferase